MTLNPNTIPVVPLDACSGISGETLTGMHFDNMYTLELVCQGLQEIHLDGIWRPVPPLHIIWTSPKVAHAHRISGELETIITIFAPEMVERVWKELSADAPLQVPLAAILPCPPPLQHALSHLLQEAHSSDRPPDYIISLLLHLVLAEFLRAELIRTQRATRQYSQQAVSEADIRTVLHAGRRAQSSNNKQPWSFVVIQDHETLQRLAACGKYATHVPDAAFALALITSSTGGAADFDLGQAAAYLQLAAWDLGIGSCITWMHNPEKAKAVLNVPTDLDFRVVLSFGYPVPQEKPQSPKKNGRKPFDEVVHWERWL